MTAVRVFHSGMVYTADAAGTRTQAVAVGHGRIMAVGSDNEVLTAYPSAELMDLGGRTMVPGFIDAHNHYLATGEGLAAIDARFPGVASPDDLVAAVAAAADDRAAGQWLSGFGFDHAKYDRWPTRWDLDRATTEHPVAIRHVSGHYLLVNSVALAAAGVNDSTPDPKGGAFVRDEVGHLTGLCLDAAMGIVEPVAVDIGSHGPNFHVQASMDDLVAAVDRAGRAYVAAGLTTVCDAQVTRREMAAYRRARALGSWWVRVACMPLSNQLAEYGAAGLASGFGDDMLWLGPMKFYMDGSLIGGTAVFTEPYGEHGEFEGIFYWQPEEMRSMITEAHRQGWQVGVHTQGDRAIEATLDAIEAAMESDPRPDPRHRIEHCGLPTAEQVARMARLGVVAINQPNYLHDQGDEFLARLGERAHRLQPLRAELEAGVTIALSSDADVTTFRPLETITNAVMRTTMGGRAIGADQALTVEEAIRAHTIDAAYSIFAEDRLGSIEPGKQADLVVIDGDPFSAPPNEIRDLEVWMTVIDGKTVFDPGGLIL
ncbi:MAG: amidohydrolase [Acidimicrobiia bacterium]|nr:amidohydrolase [Acidimicrobiia bacterium]